MENLALALCALGFRSGEDFVVRDDMDGKGPYIHEWLSSAARPTDADITAAAAKVGLPTEADYANAIDGHLDAKAQERQYDSIRTAVTYRDDPNAQFAAEAQALFDWRSAVWTYATGELAKVQAGTRTQPSITDFLAEIDAACPFAWPSEAAA